MLANGRAASTSLRVRVAKSDQLGKILTCIGQTMWIAGSKPTGLEMLETRYRKTERFSTTCLGDVDPLLAYSRKIAYFKETLKASGDWARWRDSESKYLRRDEMQTKYGVK